MTVTDFQTKLSVTEVRTSLRATYLILSDGSTARISDAVLEQLKNLPPTTGRTP